MQLGEGLELVGRVHGGTDDVIRYMGEPWLEAEAGVGPRSPKGRAAARGRAVLTPVSVSNYPFMQAGALDSDHGIYRDYQLCIAAIRETLHGRGTRSGKRAKSMPREALSA
jgi:hypothetical protein